ncbi:hypothetical protein CsSME_00017637 [Camellia sinensis var. sinensis]
MAYGSDYAEGTDILKFLKLDSDGNLRIYSSPKGSGSTATERWAAVSDQCQVFGYCGDLGICSYNDTSPFVDVLQRILYQSIRMIVGKGIRGRWRFKIVLVVQLCCS